MTVDAAAILLGRARREPAATVRRARELLTAAEPCAQVRLRHAIALASIERGELGTAAAELAEAMRLARHQLCGDLLGGLALSAAWVELERGHVAGCRNLLDEAQPLLDRGEQARASCLRGLLHYAAGEYAQACARLDDAVRELRAGADRHWLANALVGRAAAATELARFAAADADFDRAATYFRAQGEVDRAACCVHNRGFVAFRRGDLAAAMRYFEQADRAGLRVDRHPELLVDRAETYLAAGLLADARVVLERAAERFGDAQRGRKIADLLLVAADCALRAADAEAAIEVSARAARLLAEQRRGALLPVARAIWLRARIALGAHVSSVDSAAADCMRHGWHQAAAELLLAAGCSLENVARERDSASSTLRMLGWLATARLAAAADDHAAVRHAADAGLRIATRQAAACEPRSAAAGAAGALAELGLRAALADGRPHRVFRWAERSRMFGWPRPRSADALALYDALSVLREDSSDGRLAAERAARRAAVSGSGIPANVRPAHPAEVAAELGRTALLSWVSHDGTLFAVSIVDGEVLVHSGVPAAQVDELVEALRFAAIPANAALAELAARSAADAANRLDELLFEPLRALLDDRALVVVPGPLHGVCWASLPTCHRRPVSVAPSASAWLRAHRRRSGGQAARLWVAGPQLRHAEPEVRALRQRYGGTVLNCPTTAELLSAMDGADVVHIAAHGEFRGDEPMFSGLRCADGLLYAHDLHRLAAAPKVLVLASCESARHGDRLLGLGTTLLDRGSVAVIASLYPVADQLVTPLLTDLHESLAAGQTPARALAEAQARRGHLGFVCLGAG